MQSLILEKNRRILVIDDSKSIHKDFEKILVGDTKTADLDSAEAELFGPNDSLTTRYQYELTSAYQGEEGFAKVVEACENHRPYALAFVDMRMPPGWDGVETIARLWEIDPDLLIVICTAYSDYSWSEIEQQLGQSDRLLILKKPFDSIEVCQMASALVENRYLGQQARLKMSELEQMVEERTTELQREIAERKKFEHELLATKDVLEYQATHDVMTGLWSRPAICDVLEKEITRSQREQLPLGLAFVDIDLFKRINDDYGHQAGDVVLRGVAEKLKASVRPYDEIGRYGGEEFLIVLPGCRLDEATDVSERARIQIAQEPFFVGNDKIQATVSIGVTTIETDQAIAFDEVIHLADSALYEAKRSGRNRVVQGVRSDQEVPG